MYIKVQNNYVRALAHRAAETHLNYKLFLPFIVDDEHRILKNLYIGFIHLAKGSSF